jgi:choline-sulfatase
MSGQPNILFIQVDQMTAAPLPFHGGRIARAPHLQALAESSAIFESAYCNSPICAPSRFSMMTGRLPTTIDAFDNASELPAARPTLAHFLARAGYHTALSGKMHFIGPDQLHGFAQRLTTDIYPADFAWTPNWAAGPRDRPSGISMINVLQAGACVRSLQMDYDDEVEQLAVQHLYDLARRPGRKPFFLAVSFSHPHPPYTAGRQWWDRYRHDDIDMPCVPPIPVRERDVHSQWLHASHSADLQPVSQEQIRNARHAYYANISYIDDKVGHLLSTLQECGMADDTIVVFTSDHGEMLGERGMWYKQSFFEPSVRVPLLVRLPGFGVARRVRTPVSLVDLLPTLMDWAGGMGDWPEPIDGKSWVPLLWDNQDAVEQREVLSEYTDMGVIAPARMVRRSNFKYIHTHGYSPQLFDLHVDPHELENLAGREDLAVIESQLCEAVQRDWNGDEVMQRVLASQRRRLYLKAAAAAIEPQPAWDYQAHRDDSKRFVRSNGAAGAKALARFPLVPPL